MEIVNSTNMTSFKEEVGGTRACVLGCVAACVVTSGVSTVASAVAWAL